MLGSNKIYNKWNNELISSLTDEVKIKLLNALIEDINLRYEKYGEHKRLNRLRKSKLTNIRARSRMKNSGMIKKKRRKKK